MKILIRNESGSEWEAVEAQDYKGETELQKLLASSPSLISIEEIRPGSSSFVVAIREVGLPGSGSTDIIAINPDGDIALVECKLANNAEIKRKVIGQVLEYGAYLFKMSYEQLSDRIEKRTATSLADLMRNFVEDTDWDEESFRENIEQTLSDGSFILVIAVDEMNEELRRTIQFLNQCGNPAFAFTALEMQRYQKGKTEILVPHLYGGVVKTPVVGVSRLKWNKQRFFDFALENLDHQTVQIMEDLYQWSVENGKVTWGVGKVTGSYTCKFAVEVKDLSMFTVQTTGSIMFNLHHQTPHLEEETIHKYREWLTEIPSFSSITESAEWFPWINIEKTLVDHAEDVQRFKDVTLRYVEYIRSLD